MTRSVNTYWIKGMCWPFESRLDINIIPEDVFLERAGIVLFQYVGMEWGALHSGGARQWLSIFPGKNDFYTGKWKERTTAHCASDYVKQKHPNMNEGIHTWFANIHTNTYFFYQRPKWRYLELREPHTLSDLLTHSHTTTYTTLHPRINMHTKEH